MIIMNDVTFVHNICLALTTGSLAVLTAIITFNYSSIFEENDIPRKEGKISN